MKPDNTLTITSLLAIVLMSLHLTEDVVHGFEPGGLKNLSGIAILVVWLYAALVLAGSRSGHVILALGAIGTFSLILSVRGLWRLRRGQPAA